MELKASNGGINQKLPMDTVKEEGEGREENIGSVPVREELKSF